MLKKQKAITGLAGSIILLVILEISGLAQEVYVSFVAEYPDSWSKVKPGMKSHEARELLGKPHADGRGLKTLDRWEQTQGGVKMHLDISFNEGSHENAVITGIEMRKRFLGHDVDPRSDLTTN